MSDTAAIRAVLDGYRENISRRADLIAGHRAEIQWLEEANRIETGHLATGVELLALLDAETDLFAIDGFDAAMLIHDLDGTDSGAHADDCGACLLLAGKLTPTPGPVWCIWCGEDGHEVTACTARPPLLSGSGDLAVLDGIADPDDTPNGCARCGDPWHRIDDCPDYDPDDVQAEDYVQEVS